MATIYKVAAILGFPKIAVYFKLNYFKLIHLQANMLSSVIFTYFAVSHTNLLQKLSFSSSVHSLLPKDNFFKNIFDLSAAGDWDWVAAAEHLPALHYSVDFILLSFGIMGFIWEL